MNKEIKQSLAFLIIIAIVLLFTFIGADEIRDIPYERSTEDVLKELRLELFSYARLIYDLKQENRMLRILLHEDKAKLYALVDAVYRANKALAESNERLRMKLEEKYWDIFRSPLRED